MRNLSSGYNIVIIIFSVIINCTILLELLIADSALSVALRNFAAVQDVFIFNSTHLMSRKELKIF